MTTTDSGELIERITAAHGALSPLEQRVADFLRARPDESALYNSSELARLTGVSKATVSRLFRRLGFAGSYEVRDLLRAQRGAGVPVAVGGVRHPASRFDEDVANLRRLAEGLDPAGLCAAAEAIAAAPRVLVAGFRSGYPIAMLLRQALVQARPRVALVPEAGQTMGEEVVGLDSGDVVVIVALRRQPSGLAAFLRSVAASPSRVVLISDPSLETTAADWRFDVPIDSLSPFDSYAAAAGFVSVLAGEVLGVLGPVGAARVAAIGRSYQAFGELAR